VESAAGVLPRRQPGQRRADPALTVRYACPRCGGAHPAAECGVLAVRELDAIGLRRLRRAVLEELGRLVLARESTEDMGRLLAAIDSRLAREDGDRGPSLERRQRLAAERDAVRTGG
jgi:hypothetical protein